MIQDWVRGVSPEHLVFFLVSSLNECWPGKGARGFPLFRLPSTWVIPRHLSLTFGLSSPSSFGPEDWAGQFHLGSLQQLAAFNESHLLCPWATFFWSLGRNRAVSQTACTPDSLSINSTLVPATTRKKGLFRLLSVFWEEALHSRAFREGLEVFKNRVLAQQRSHACWEETL